MYSVNIAVGEKLTDVSKSLYGLFFEDINRAGDGGLYAELLRNRAFDDGIIPEGCKYDPMNKTITSPTGWVSSFDCCEAESIAGWTAKNGAEMRLISNGTLNENRKRALSVEFHGGEIQNEGFDGIPIEKGKSYRFYMFARSDTKAEITVCLCGLNKESYCYHSFCVDGGYKRYECEMISAADDNNARLTFTGNIGDMVVFGFVSLFPTDTFMGRENGLRNDLVQRLLQLKPAFLRFPGGCIVEGFSKQTAFRFKDTIGPVWERKPHWLLWSYMTTNGLGFHEYLQFCEDAKIDAMYVCNCGMTCQGRCPDYFDDKLINEFLEDAVQAILYALSPADTEWGAKRAANGHPEPFTCLKYIEIGNENWGGEYDKRYGVFYKKLKELFPQLIFISTDHTEKSGLKTECVDEHFYSDPIFFAANANRYDSFDRNGVDIYCGEYASTIGCKAGTLYGALGEAAFLTGIERNQDKVKMTSYAPLFKNADCVSWEPDLIAFDNHRSYVIPSYHMLKMFAENRGDSVCRCDIVTESDRRMESGCFRLKDGTVINGNKLSGEFEKDALHIRFWDKGTDGEEQDHYDFTVDGNISRVIHYNGWSSEVICDDTPFLPKELNSVEITTDCDSFSIYINGKELHSHTLAPIPHLFGVCTVDNENGEVIAKLVNFSEDKVQAKLSCDKPLDKAINMTVLTAPGKNAKNTFEEPNVVCPYTVQTVLPDNGMLELEPLSVNVLKMKIKA